MRIMKFGCAAFVVAVVSLSSISWVQAAIVYQVNETFGPQTPGAITTDGQTLSAIGTITTNGKVGVLAASDILDFSIALNGYGSPVTLTSNNSTLLFDGTDLVATPNVLMFNFSDPGFGRFGFQNGGNSFGLFSSGFNQQNGGVFDIVLNLTQSSIIPASTLTIAVAAVPEPSTWAMMVLGFACLGAVTYRKRRARTSLDASIAGERFSRPVARACDKSMAYFCIVRAVASFGFLLGASAPSFAEVVLAPVQITGYLDINYLGDQSYIDNRPTYNQSAPINDTISGQGRTSASASVHTGLNPSLVVNVDTSAHTGLFEGAAALAYFKLVYQFEVIGPTASVALNVMAGGSAQGSGVDAVFRVDGPNSIGTVLSQNLPLGAGSWSVDQAYQFQTSIPYTVTLEVLASSHSSINQSNSAFAMVDPLFSIDSTVLNSQDYRLVFSEGVFNVAGAVPEPSTWAMMILGFAGIGFMTYRHKSKVASPSA